MHLIYQDSTDSISKSLQVLMASQTFTINMSQVIYQKHHDILL